MNDAELLSFCNEMIGKFKMLSDLQKEMQYELIDTKFTEWELKKLIFALDVLRTIADRPQGEWIEQDDCWQCSECGDEYVLEVGVKPIDARMHYCPNCGARMKGADDYERATEQMEHDALYEPTYNSEDGSM